MPPSPRCLPATLAFSVVMSACGPEPLDLELPTHAGPVRLVDVVDDSHFVTAFPPPAPELDPTLQEAFDDTDWSIWHRKPGGKKDESPALITAKDGALVIGSEGRPRQLPWVGRKITTGPRASLRLTARIRTEDLSIRGSSSEGASIELLEYDKAGKEVSSHDHLLRERGTTDGWVDLTYVFRTQSNTRTVEVRLVPGRGLANGRAMFDDIMLRPLTTRQSLAGLRPVDTPPRTAPPHEQLKQVMLDLDERPAILSQTPGTFGLNLEVTEPSRLRFAVGRAPHMPSQATLCFRVRWADTSDALYDHCIEPRQGWKWEDARIPLDAGPARPLIFETYTPHEDKSATGAWGNPRVVPIARPPDDQRPNIVLLLFDTLRAEHLTSEGYTRRPTSPFLDSLAKSSIRYSRAFSTSGWTAPSFASLMTSRYPSQHRAGSRIARERHSERINSSLRHKNELVYAGIDAAEEPVVIALKQAGYATAGFYSNYFFGSELGFGQGYDRYQTYRANSYDGANAGVKLAREWLAERQENPDGQPFLLTMHFVDPHMPYRLRENQTDDFPPPEGLAGSHTEKDKTFIFTQFNQKSLKQMEEVKVVYDAEIAWMDRAAGELMESVDQLDNTLVLATADHGEAFLDHGKIIHGNALYNELVRIPMYLRPPDRSQAGVVVDSPVSLLDVAPTLLDAAGLEIPENMEGRPLLPVTGAGLPEDGLMLESVYMGPDISGVTDGDYKYLFTWPRGYLGMQTRDADWKAVPKHLPVEALYDIVADPGEQTNLIAEQPERAAHLRAQLMRHFSENAPGLHIRCQPGDQPLQIKLKLTDSIIHIAPLRLDGRDRVILSPTRDSLSLHLTETEQPDWLLVRTQRPGLTATLESQDGALVRRGSGEPTSDLSWTLSEEMGGAPDLSAPLPAGRCDVWEVGHGRAESSRRISNETAQMLQEMGYMD